MSIKLMTQVWESELPQNLKYTLLAYADFANDEGSGIWPSQDYMAWKTGYSVRSIAGNTKTLTEMGIMTQTGRTEYGNNIYRINPQKLPSRASWQEERDMQKLHPPAKTASGNMQKLHEGDAKTAYNPSVEPSVEPTTSANAGDRQEEPDPVAEDFSDWFPEGEQESTRLKVPDGVNPAEWFRERAAQARQRGIERAADMPWAYWHAHHSSMKSRDGISKQSLQRVGWLIELKTGLVPTERGMKGWVAGLSQVYDAAGGDFDVIELGIDRVMRRDRKYRPGHVNGFVDEVRKVAAERKVGTDKPKFSGVKFVN